MFPEDPASRNYLRLVSMAQTKSDFIVGPKLYAMLDQIIEDSASQEFERVELSLRNFKVLLRLLGSLPFAKPVTAADLIHNIQTNQIVLQIALKLARGASNEPEVAEIQEALDASETCIQSLRK